MTRIAGRLREWRLGENMTLQNLADRSDVSPSTIHKIENGQSVPTIAVLLKLAEGLGRRAAELLEDDRPESFVSHTHTHDRPRIVTKRGTRIEWVVDGLTDPILEMWRASYPPEYSTGDDLIRNEQGEFIILCQEGELTVQLGDDHFEMQPGDSVHFKANRPFGWRNRGSSQAVVLLIGALPHNVRGGVVEQLTRLRETSIGPDCHSGSSTDYASPANAHATPH